MKLLNIWLIFVFLLAVIILSPLAKNLHLLLKPLRSLKTLLVLPRDAGQIEILYYMHRGLRFKDQFKYLNYYSIPESVLFVLRKRLNYLAYVIWLVIFFFFFVCTPLLP